MLFPASRGHETNDRVHVLLSDWLELSQYAEDEMFEMKPNSMVIEQQLDDFGRQRRVFFMKEE